VPLPNEPETQAAHLEDLSNGYASAERYLGILTRYHQGRIDRARAATESGVSDVDQRAAINTRGDARPYIDG
jgi:hypothetical protein